MPRCRLRRDGFTLTELVVVIAGIALLAILLNPVIQHAIEQSRSAACVSHLHLIYGGLQAYSSDHNEHLPDMLPMRASASDSGPTLDTALTSYLPDPSVFHCPADHSLFAQSGCSYLWIYGYSVNSQGHQNDSMITASFPLLQENGLTQIPFVSDKESFHKTSPATHVLYGDGSVQ